MRKVYRFFILLAALLLIGTLPGMAQNDDLQDFINSVASGGNTSNPLKRTTTDDGFTIVDLSEFSAVERTTTLEVPSGVNLRFVNGTLSRTEQLYGPVMKISGGSIVEISSSDGTYSTRAYICNYSNVANGHEIIRLEAGILLVKDYGEVDGGRNNTSGKEEDNAILMTSDDTRFYLEDNGWVSGLVVCNSSLATIQVNGGSMKTSSADYGTINTFSDVFTNGHTWLQINLLGDNNLVKLTSTPQWNTMILAKISDNGRKVVEGYEGYVITEDDHSKFEIISAAGSKLNTYLKDSAIYIGDDDDLQAFINSTPTNASDYTIVDLSKFKAKIRTKTLEITDGRKIRFVNGRVMRVEDSSSSLDGPLVTISNGSKVELSSSDGTSQTGAVFDSSHGSGDEVVRLNYGTICVKDYGWISTGYIGEECDNAVKMTSDEDYFYLEENGLVSGPVVNENWFGLYNVIEITGGTMETGSFDYGTIKTYSNVTTVGTIPLHVNLLGKENFIKLKSNLAEEIQITAPEKTYNDVIATGIPELFIEPSHVLVQESYTLTQEDLSKVNFINDKSFGLYLSTKNTGHAICIGIDDLQSFINNIGSSESGGSNGDGTEDNPYKGYIPCSGVNVNNDVNFDGDDLQYYILYGKMPSDNEESDEDCEGTVLQNDGDVHISAGSTVTFKEINWQGCGCTHYIYVSGTLIIDVDIHIYNYLRFIHVLPGGRVVIRDLNGEVIDEVIYVEGGTVEYHGGNISGNGYGWYNTGGTIYIHDGAIAGGTCGGYTGYKGMTYIYGGTVTGGIINYGTTYIYGGTITGGTEHTIYNHTGGTMYIYGGTWSGTETIWNEGDLYLGCGDVTNIGEIYMVKGCHIYIVEKLTYILRLHITIENIILDTPIIIGSDGYRLTQEDCANLNIELPEGYAWRYDETSGGIVIYFTAETGSKTIHVETAGTLSNLLSESDKSEITDLTITGKLNGTDIVVLQEMANTSMKTLDMSGADIVAGGSVYYTFTTPIGTTQYTTSNNVVGSYMFTHCTVLEKVVLPLSATKIESGAFGYSSLRSMTIGPNVAAITAGLSAGTPLDEIILNGNASFILQDGILYDSAKAVVYKAISSISGDIVLPNTVSTIKNSSFSECQLRSIVIPSGVTEMETAVFSGCANLEEVSFPASLTKVGYSSFANCKSLKEVDLSNTQVTLIDGNAFYNCPSIVSVQLPSTLKEIRGSVFTSRVLSKITCAAATPPTIEDGTYKTFQYSSIAGTCTLFVPENSIGSYKTATGWNNFFKVSDIDNEQKVKNSDDLQDFINNLVNGNDKGTEEEPKEIPVSSDGLDVDKDVSVDDDLQLFINGIGNNASVKTLIHYSSGMIYNNNEACGWTFRNIMFSDGDAVGSPNNSPSTVSETRGFCNKGKLVLDDCLLSDGKYVINNQSSGILVLKNSTSVAGSSNIINGGTMYTDGSCRIGNILNKYGADIYVTGELTEQIMVTISDAADVEQGSGVIMGAEGYVLSENDCSFITMMLPDGYEWHYDAARHAIVVNIASGISSPDMEKTSVIECYDAAGRKITSSKGLNIQILDNGKVRKVISK